MHGDAFECEIPILMPAIISRPRAARFTKISTAALLADPFDGIKHFSFQIFKGRYNAKEWTRVPSVPSLQDRSGNFSDLASSLNGTVSGPYFANLLSQKLGYAVAAGESYYTSGCSVNSVRISKCRHSAESVVRNGATALAVHSAA